MSSVYLRLLIFLLAILIPACASSSPAFHMMYSAYKLNNQGDNTQPWRTPFPILNQSAVPCPVLTAASWPSYIFLRRQLRWSGIPISLRIFHSLLSSIQGRKIVWHSFKSVSFNLCSTFIQMHQGKTDFSVSKNYVQKENHLFFHVHDPSGVSSKNIQQNIFFCVCVWSGT